MSNRQKTNENYNEKGAKNFKETMKKLWLYLRQYKLQMIVVLIFTVGSAIFNILGPNILRKATNKIVEGFVGKMTGIENSMDFNYISSILLIIFGLYIASTIFGIVQGRILTTVSQNLSYELRKNVFGKINKLPLKYFDNTNYGDVLSRITNDVDSIGQTLNQSMSQIITAIVTIIGVLIMMLSISWQMTLISLLILPLSFGIMAVIIGKSQKYFTAQQKHLGETNGYVEEIYGGQNIVKAFNQEESSSKDFNKLNKNLYDSSWKAQFVSSVTMPLMNLVGNIGYVLVSISGGWFAIRNVIQVGDILAFIQYIRNFTQPIAQVAQTMNILQSTAAAAERVFEFLEEEEESPDVEKGEGIDNIKGNVSFENVIFGYGDDKIIIDDFTIDIKQGQTVAIVGPTGSGKTTIIKLLMRFYDLNSGKIMIDGIDIMDFKRGDLRSLFGMVLQDTWLYSDTIMENIRYGNLSATDEEVVEAAKLAYADNFIRTLPDSYNMIINEEASNISQGQKQLLTIARALISDPKILILDEATSSVDTRTEQLIQNAMNNLMKGRTSFVIAHRLSTIKDADNIIVMDQGKIIETGKHNQLLEKDGFYASLYNSQFET